MGRIRRHRAMDVVEGDIANHNGRQLVWQRLIARPAAPFAHADTDGPGHVVEHQIGKGDVL